MSRSLSRNVGLADRVIRGIIGGALLATGLGGDRPLWSVLGLVVLLTAAVSFCPLYAMLRISTRPGNPA